MGSQRGRRGLGGLLSGFFEPLVSFASNFLSFNTIANDVDDTSLAIGYECSVTGVHSLASGLGASAVHYGSFTRASGVFAQAGDAQVIFATLRNTTSDGSWTELFLDGVSQRLVIPNLSAWSGTVTIVARRSDALTEAAAYIRAFGIKRDATAGTTRIVGAVGSLLNAEDTAAWGVNVGADTTNGSLQLTVLGEAAKSIKWVAFVQLVQVSVIVA